MTYKAPKGIASHPAVEECGYGPTEGIEDYRHAVWLKADWRFSNGRMEGCRSGNFNTAQEFLRACPVRKGDRLYMSS